MTETQITNIAGRTFDYVIAGGGTAGLTLAARLSEDPSVTVAVLEAGHANLNDPNILVPAQYGKNFLNRDYDWGFFTTKQKHCNDRPTLWARGRSLGGSSSINFNLWSKPPAQDFDAIEKLGNKGWNWESFVKYSQRSETFHEPTQEQLADFPHTFDPKHRGKVGPVQTSIPHNLHTVDKPFLDTLNNMGLPTLRDPYGGDITGAWIGSASIDPKTHTRSYAATAYYQPNQHRPNLTVLTEATVCRVIFAPSTPSAPNDDLTATGLEFHWAPQGEGQAQPYVVSAHKEVILSTGTVCDPQILELSGVGHEEVLERLGVEVKIALPGVGENVQEHLYAGISFELDDQVDHQTLDLLRDPAVAAQHMKLHASQQGIYRTGITGLAYLPLSLANPRDTPSLISIVAKGIETQKAKGALPPGLTEQYDIQLETLRDDKIPDLQLILYPGLLSQTYMPKEGKRYCMTMLAMNHPFSRGTIHATSTDPTKPPEIDPHTFENDFDLENMVQSFKFVRAMTQTEPWKSTVAREVDPGPECTKDDEIRDFIKNAVSPVWHAIGSCSMLPREKQGVVDSNLKVYGTKNLRVVDISILPLHISAHTQATAYVIGEKAADIIRGRV